MGSGTLRTAASESGGGRDFKPGLRAAFGLALVAAAAAGLIILLSPGGTQPHGRVSGYGRLPSWLPKISNATPRLELAKPASPILSEEQGYTVHAELGRGSVDVTASGPEIPAYVSSDVQRGSWPDSRPVPGTFIVTLMNVSGTVPLRASSFSILTNAGQILHPLVRVKGGGRLPASLHAGQRINLLVRGGVIEGQGSIRWAPLGSRVLVGWIYQLELD